MIITNELRYPSSVVVMANAQLQRPEASVMRVTSLIAPPAIRYYQLHNWNDIVVDVDDFLLSGMGTAWHQYLAQFAPDVADTGYYSEQTLQVQHNGIIISGTPDIRTAVGAIEDYKVTSAWSFVFAKPEWEQQLNIYSQLSERNGFPITKLTIHAFLRDWSARNAMQYRPDYPDKPFYSVNIPLWPIERRTQFVAERVIDHQRGLRPCTSEERWQRPTTWAVIKRGVKKASRVLDTQEEAQMWLATTKKPPDYYIECRKGSCRRCEDYCFVRSVCKFRSIQ